jgi:hypothetical protein
LLVAIVIKIKVATNGIKYLIINSSCIIYLNEGTLTI